MLHSEGDTPHQTNGRRPPNVHSDRLSGSIWPAGPEATFQGHRSVLRMNVVWDGWETGGPRLERLRASLPTPTPRSHSRCRHWVRVPLPAGVHFSSSCALWSYSDSLEVSSSTPRGLGTRPWSAGALGAETLPSQAAPGLPPPGPPRSVWNPRGARGGTSAGSGQGQQRL